MHFYAYLKPHSALDREWRQKRLFMGWVKGVSFQFYDATTRFESNELGEDEIEKLKSEPQVVLEVLSIPLRRPDSSVSPDP